MRTLPSLLIAALFASGCATVRTMENFHGVRVEGGAEPLASVEVENSGWFILKSLPLGSGDVRYPNSNTCRWFQNTVTLQNNLEMFDCVRQQRGATRVVNLTSRRTEESFLFILLTRQAYHTSGVLLKDDSVPAKEISE